MPGIVYGNPHDGLRTDVKGLKNVDDPEEAGFDFHSLYPDEKEKDKINPRPYSSAA